MDYGGVERRRTKKDLKRKRRVRVYKRGGQTRGIEFSSETEEENKTGKKKKGKKKK